MRILKEPLLHFLLAGGVLFGAYTWLNRTAESPGASKTPQVHVGAAEAQWLAENWTRQWRRPPTQDELRGLLTEYLNEQLLAREARALGLDDNDVIVRRRLAQKLTFLIDGTLRRTVPSDDELQQFYDAHAQRFRNDARISFTQVYFNPERRTDAHADAKDALKVLLESGAVPPKEGLGDRLLIEAEIRDETERTVSGSFGADFARAVFSLKPGVWSGPIESGYGLHLVRISALRDAELRPFSEVRARVVEEWRGEQERSAKEMYLAQLRKKYDVFADEAIKSLLAPPSKTADP